MWSYKPLAHFLCLTQKLLVSLLQTSKFLFGYMFVLELRQYLIVPLDDVVEVRLELHVKLFKCG